MRGAVLHACGIVRLGGVALETVVPQNRPESPAVPLGSTVASVAQPFAGIAAGMTVACPGDIQGSVLADLGAGDANVLGDVDEPQGAYGAVVGAARSALAGVSQPECIKSASMPVLPVNDQVVPGVVDVGDAVTRRRGNPSHGGTPGRIDTTESVTAAFWGQVETVPTVAWLPSATPLTSMPGHW